MSDNNRKQQSAHKTHEYFARKRRIVIGLITAAVFVFGVAAGWFFVYNQSKLKSPETTESKESVALEKANKTISDAQKLVDSNKTKEAIELYDSAIENADSEQQKDNLLMAQATVYFNNDQYDKALAIALALEKKDSNETTTFFVAQIYEEKGDNKNAIIYYKKAISSADVTGELGDYYKQYYQSKVEELSV